MFCSQEEQALIHKYDGENGMTSPTKLPEASNTTSNIVFWLYNLNRIITGFLVVTKWCH